MNSMFGSFLIDSMTPSVVKENLQLFLFFGALSYALFLVNWIVTTDWEEKFNWFSLVTGLSGLLYLHYEAAQFLDQYEALFVTTWVSLLCYHTSTWKNNYQRVAEELYKKNDVFASLKPFRGSIFRFFIIMPTSKNASNQWKAPPFKNAIHILLVGIYSALLALHASPYVTPMPCWHGSGDKGSSSLCCRYNYVMQGVDSGGDSTTAHQVNSNFCSGRVRIAFSGSWSTGKTTIIGALLGHNYSTSQIAPAPTTDKFVCLALGAPYSDPIRSDDFERRRHCEIISHINDLTHRQCGAQLPNTLDVADTNTEFDNFVFFDMPGWQREYGESCVYRTFYRQLLEMVDFVYVVWDVNHGKVEDEYAEFFKNKARGTNYELIYNRYMDDTVDMAFLNQQYAKMSNGQEVLSQMYTMKLHENNERHAVEFEEDLLLLRAKIKSVNQTVHDNRKKLMKQNLMTYRSKITGFQALRKLKIGDRLIRGDLNVHVPPKMSWLHSIGIEL